jgi:secondary thiamine-phosphate synthase enzyme
MSKSSTMTVRDTPISSVSAGGPLVVRADTLTVQTDQRVQLVDLTDMVLALARRSGVTEGTVSLWSMHTTCALFINEAQRALHADIKTFLERTVDRDAEWVHNDPDQSDCDRFNADSHLRAMLLGHSMTLQVSGGDVVLGQWQRILMAELDGPRARDIRVQVMGIGNAPAA